MSQSVKTTTALLMALRVFVTKDSNHHGTSKDSFYDSDMLLPTSLTPENFQ